MSAEPAPLRRLTVVDKDSGEVVDPEVARLQERIAILEQNLRDAEKDLRTKRAQITKLRKDKVRERLEYARRDDVDRIHSYWQRRLGHGKALTADRFDAVRGLLEETHIEVVDGKPVKVDTYELSDFKAAIDGAHYDPYCRTLKNGKVTRYDDLSLHMPRREDVRELHRTSASFLTRR
jgi:ribosomal protein S15P/S13E